MVILVGGRRLCDMRDLYQVLGVQAGAADEEIKAALRRLAKQLHPDLHPGNADAERQLQEVTRAYETLSHGPSRLAYDAGLAKQRSLTRWRFAAMATAVVFAFMVTLSVIVFWGDLRQAFLSVDQRPLKLADNEPPPPPRVPPKEAVEGGGGGVIKDLELPAGPSDGPSAKSPALADAKGSDGRPAPPVEGPSAGREVTSDTGGAGEREKAAASAREPGSAWWVVLASYNVSSAAPEIASGVRHTAGAAQLCGSRAFNDLSTKFHGFTPGYMVVVIGPFAIKADAARSQQQVNACVSGAYLKYARHHGE